VKPLGIADEHHDAVVAPLLQDDVAGIAGSTVRAGSDRRV
jgi:hypothetical protein